MNLNNCLFEKPSNVSVGAFLLLVGFGFVLSGLTVLPIVGFFLALPVFALAGVFLTARRSRECALQS